MGAGIARGGGGMTTDATAILARATVFAGLGQADLDRVAARVDAIDVAADALLWEEGSAPEALYVIAAGEFAITKRVAGADGDTLVNVCGPGEVLGEMSLLEQLPRSATVRATRPSHVLRLGADAFDEILRASPAIALAILRVVTARLRNTESVLRQFDKLTGLGRIAAGIAHELDNPAAALVRGAADLDDIARGLAAVAIDLSRASADVAVLDALAAAHATAPALSPLERSERETSIRAALDRHGVADAWSIAPALANAGWTAGRIDDAAAKLGAARAPGLRWLGLGRAAVDLLDEQRSGAKKISAIVASVRRYSHLGAAAVTRLDVRDGVESAITLLSHRLKGMRIARSYAADVPAIDAYGAELEQVWTNLIDNAADAAGDGGAIEIAIARDGDAGGVAVEIADDGPGIPADVLPRLFEPFFTTKPPGSGTGLGLHIAYDVVVRKHRGRIDVASRPGRTAFRVVLPARAGAEVAS
jgi:signal transduction histidine kinase